MHDGHHDRPRCPSTLAPHMLIPLAYALCGLVVGVLVGLTGVGGGSLMTPMLVLVFGLPPAVAVGTDLLFSASTKLDQLISRCLAVILGIAAVALLLHDSWRRWGLKFAAAWFVGNERHIVLLTVA